MLCITITIERCIDILVISVERHSLNISIQRVLNIKIYGIRNSNTTRHRLETNWASQWSIQTCSKNLKGNLIKPEKLQQRIPSQQATFLFKFIEAINTQIKIFRIHKNCAICEMLQISPSPPPKKKNIGHLINGGLCTSFSTAQSS